MKMTKTLKKKWIKALLSGEYGQTANTMCDGNGNFCCLGVLECVAMNDEVEVKTDGDYWSAPTSKFYEYAGIELQARVHYPNADADIAKLIDMNDDYEWDDEEGEDVHHSTFKDIALWIDKNIKTF